MIEEVKSKVKELLASKQIKGFIGLVEKNGHIGPHLFTTEEELDNLNLGEREQPGDSRYPLDKLLVTLSRKYPEETFGILVRGCDERGLHALNVWNQIDMDKVVPVGINCPQELADKCECFQPYTNTEGIGEKASPVSFRSVDNVEEMDFSGRMAYWQKEFAKCVKCFGCRDICPMCFCNECSLENQQLIKTYNLPPENPIFHLTRAVHMAGRCIDCGLCEEACPADIPLRTLYKKVAEIMEQDFGYTTGVTDAQKPPFNIAN